MSSGVDRTNSPIKDANPNLLPNFQRSETIALSSHIVIADLGYSSYARIMPNSAAVKSNKAFVRQSNYFSQHKKMIHSTGKSAVCGVAGVLLAPVTGGMSLVVGGGLAGFGISKSVYHKRSKALSNRDRNALTKLIEKEVRQLIMAHIKELKCRLQMLQTNKLQYIFTYPSKRYQKWVPDRLLSDPCLKTVSYEYSGVEGYQPNTEESLFWITLNWAIIEVSFTLR